MRLILSLTLLAVLGACAGGNKFDLSRLDLNQAMAVGENIAKASSDMSDMEEIDLGTGIAANLLGAAPLLPNPEMQRYVNRVGQWLALQTERPTLPWRFGVLDSANVNAFATPGGYIFVTSGLMQRLNNESELAGVLSHEIAHVLQRHHVQAIRKAAGADAMAGIASMAAAQRGDSRSQQLSKLFSAGTELYITGLSKEDELAADRAGVVIASRAGYHPYGLVSVLQTLNRINPQDGAVALMFKTHPSPTSRLDALDQAMGSRLARYESGVIDAPRFAKLKK
jgi:predicted Zn-dependent protease